GDRHQAARRLPQAAPVHRRLRHPRRRPRRDGARPRRPARAEPEGCRRTGSSHRRARGGPHRRPLMIRVLVVDDSAFVRKAIALMLERAPDIQVAGTARDGEEALAQVRALDPDVVTLDVEMPGMDGLTALRQLIREAPRPVLMISSLTQEGAATTVEALAAGAFDFISKEHARISTSITKIESDLHQKVRQAARARRRPLRPAPGAAPPR